MAKAVAADLAVVLVFAAIGRSVHRHAESAGGLVSTTWPFAVGVAAGWLLVRVGHRRGSSVGEGAAVVVTTVVVGMALRVLAGQGSAPVFWGVALCFLGLGMLGWRIAAALVMRRQDPKGSA